MGCVLARGNVQLLSDEIAVRDKPCVQVLELPQQHHGRCRIVTFTQQLREKLALSDQIFLHECDMALELFRLVEE